MLLGDTCAIRSGLTLRTRPPEGSAGALAIQQGDLSPAGRYAPRVAVRVDTSDHAPHHLVSPGDVLFRSRGPFWSAWAVEESTEPLVAIAPLFVIHTSSDIDPGYLAWALGRPAAQRYFAAEAMGTAVKMISKPVLERLPLELAPITVQRSIARHAALAAREEQLLARLANLNLTLTGAQLDRAVHAASSPSNKRTS